MWELPGSQQEEILIQYECIKHQTICSGVEAGGFHEREEEKILD